jgi:hypothetical protein
LPGKHALGYDRETMKYLLLLGLYISPVLLLNYLVMPELAKLQHFYSNIETYSQQAAYGDLQSTERERYTRSY